MVPSEQAHAAGAAIPRRCGELARRQRLAEQPDAACRRLESQAKARGESERKICERSVAECLGAAVQDVLESERR